jgi:hypothetical protein
MHKDKLAFYTCFYGSDNNVAFKIPELPSLKYNCYYYTNNPTLYAKLGETRWIRIYDDVPSTDDLFESNMLGKRVKACPQNFAELRDYTYLCFLDSKSDKLNETFVETYIQKYFVEQSYALLLREHWFVAGNVWDEYNVSLGQERYRMESAKYREYIVKQRNNGLSEITPHHCACPLLIRNMEHERILELNTTWYEHILDCGIQDQISFFFVKQLFMECIHPFTENPF